MKSGIYIIKCISNGVSYIGSAIDLDKRINQHKYALNRGDHKRKIQNAWNKYGEENFVFEILEYVEDVKELIKREQYYLNNILFAIEFILGQNNKFRQLAFNNNPTAESRLGSKSPPFTEEHKRKISEGVKKSYEGKRGEEKREKIRNGQKNRNNHTHSEESREKMSISHMGKKLSADTIAKMSKFQKGRKHSETHISNRATALRGKKRTEEQRKRMSEAQKGRIISEETKQKMREAHKKRRKII